MSADVRDILELERPITPELTKEALWNKQKRPINELWVFLMLIEQTFKTYSDTFAFACRTRTKSVKRPEGMHREVYALLYNDNKDAPPLMQTDTGSGYKQVKARLGMKNVRKWEWTPFKNPARTDGAIFHHWRRIADDQKEYPFAKFNKKLNIVTYTNNEYNTHLRTNQSKWSKTQTDHLFDLARRFDLRFVVMADRWDRANHGTKTVEDLKERYYEVVGVLTKVEIAFDRTVTCSIGK